MNEWKALIKFMYGGGDSGSGFWYSHPLREIDGLTEEQLYWTPSPHSLCMLWHVGHIAHRERFHIGVFLQRFPVQTIIPFEMDVFGPEWASVEEIHQSVGSAAQVMDWTQETRQKSRQYIESLKEEDLFTVPAASQEGLTIAHWLFITACHTSLHIGRIQFLRAMLEGQPERAC